MQARFFFYETRSGNGEHCSLWRSSRLDGVDESDCNKYLLASLDTDFSANFYGHIDTVLSAVAKIEVGELGECEWEGQGFTIHITRDRVRFEHSVFGECPEWPIWCCTLAQYKAALQGYRRFLDLPKSIDTQLVIELPAREAPCD